MTNREFISLLETSYKIEDTLWIYINRLLRLNVNFQDSFRLLLKHGASLEDIVKFLFTISMYCDYSVKTLDEMNTLIKDVGLRDTDLISWMYTSILHEQSSDITLHYYLEKSLKNLRTN